MEIASEEPPKPVSETTPKNTTKTKPRKPRNQNKQKLKNQLICLLTQATQATHCFLSSNDLLLLPSQSLSLESLLSSLPFPPPQPPIYPSFFHRFISDSGSDSGSDPRWFDFFRMSKASFLNLLSLLTPCLISFLPASIPPDSAVACTLFRLAHGGSFGSSARRFGLDSSAAACIAFYSVCKVITEKLAHLIDFRGDFKQIIMGFNWISFPNCCGVLGFEKFGSLLVQALVDSEGRFLDISVGWPSNVRPGSIFSQTKLYKRIEESKELLNGPSYQLNDGILIPQYMLGDCSLPMLPWLLTPYNIGSNEEKDDTFGSVKRGFNSSHSRAMKLVNTAFRRVKSRWQLLDMEWKDDDHVEFFPFVIVMGCLLHNFLIKCREQMPEEENVETEQALPVFEGEVDEKGRRIRDVLAMHLRRVSMRS